MHPAIGASESENLRQRVGGVRGMSDYMFTLSSEATRDIVKLMTDLLPDGTIVTFSLPDPPAMAIKPPVDYAMNAEPWESVA